MLLELDLVDLVDVHMNESASSTPQSPTVVAMLNSISDNTDHDVIASLFSPGQNPKGQAMQFSPGQDPKGQAMQFSPDLDIDTLWDLEFKLPDPITGYASNTSPICHNPADSCQARKRKHNTLCDLITPITCSASAASSIDHYQNDSLRKSKRQKTSSSKLLYVNLNDVDQRVLALQDRIDTLEAKLNVLMKSKCND